MDRQHSQPGNKATTGELQDQFERVTEKTGAAPAGVVTAEVCRLNDEAGVQLGNLQTTSGPENGPTEASEKELEDTKLQPSQSQAEEHGDAGGGMDCACCVDNGEPVGMSGNAQDVFSQDSVSIDGIAPQEDLQGTSQSEPGPTRRESCRMHPGGCGICAERLQQFCEFVSALVRQAFHEALQTLLQEPLNKISGA